MTEQNVREAAVEEAAEREQQGLEGGSYDVLRARLREQGSELGHKTDALNERRRQVFGGTELEVIGNERVRTENNCVPVDIVSLGDLLVFGYNVFIGLKSEVQVTDVFSLQQFRQAEEGGFELTPVPLEQGAGGFLADPRFVGELKELYEYYKETRLQLLRRTETKLLAVFQIGAGADDVRVFRWSLGAPGQHPSYIDNRGERDHSFPPSHDFAWKSTSREDHVAGRHPHVSILDQVFVETVGGDLTIKVENNTEDGLGIYREPVLDADQSLDDAQILYAKVGQLYLLKVLPYREEQWRYFVFNKRTQRAHRIDAIGQACVSLPEDQGIIFPGGYYLQSGERKVFDGDVAGLLFHRTIRSPNGEDVLYSFLRQRDGRYVLLPYNVIRKEVQNPVICHGFSIYPDGKMIVFRVSSDEATRVHPMQIWQTPFTSAEYEASVPQDGSYLGKVGNADLVRGIAEAYGIRRQCAQEEHTRQGFEDLVAAVDRTVDGFYWLEHDEVGNLLATLKAIRQTTELIIDEYDKVRALQQRAQEALGEAQVRFEEAVREQRPDELQSVEAFMQALTSLRSQRGQLIGLRELRYVDLAALEQLEQRIGEQFDRVSEACVAFLLTDEALAPLMQQLEQVDRDAAEVDKRTEIDPLLERVDALSAGLNLLSEIAGGLQVEDTTARTRILEGISEVFALVNRVRATVELRRKEIMSREGRAEFAAQFKLLAQSVDATLARADSPEGCDEGLSRLLLQLEEIEGRFSEFDDFVAQLALKREEIVEAFGARKQTLTEQRQRRAETLLAAADRIFDGVGRRARTLKSADEINAYFAADPMLLKLHQLIERLGAMGESVKADELESRLKSARQDAIRLQRDRSDLFEEGDALVRFGRHRFSVNTQPLELTLVPRRGELQFHLSGTDYYGPVEQESFAETRPLWEQALVSESAAVYRGEYLAATILLAAEQGEGTLSLEQLQQAQLEPQGVLTLVRQATAERYDEGYERGVHDADAAAILARLLALRATAGLLRFPPAARALAVLFWAFQETLAMQHEPELNVGELREAWQRRAASLARLRSAFSHHPAIAELGQELSAAIARTAGQAGMAAAEGECRLAGQYLAEELMRAEFPVFVTGAEAQRLCDALLAELDAGGHRAELEQDLQTLVGRPGEALALAQAWLEAFVRQSATPELQALAHVQREAAALLVTTGLVERRASSAMTRAEVGGLLGQHALISGGTLQLRLDEFLERLSHYIHHQVPRYRAYRAQRQQLIDGERARLRLSELKPRVLTSFVRNRLINEVYLPLIGDNLAKQLGAAGSDKRTDLMGMLLLISPPGYGKTTLMEYIASQLGLVFIKVNGPALGHLVTSLDPTEAKSATARQEVDKINLALEMGNNVMLYLDDIQHTSPELLQKFISLCDAQRRIEGVWRGRTRTYDLRGKRFCVVMAGNPYTESGERFRIPDMLSNRADTYNLGDILEGKEELFALSYIENALTSNPTLAPLSGREPRDVHLLVRMAQGEEVPPGELQHPYSAGEIADMTRVLRHLLAVQQLLLSVNQHYIISAAQEEAYRTEPPFQLQGSYRNMNKLAEKIVPVMNDEELSRLLTDHYVGEAQTLTTGAEHNLLKLGELRGTLSAEEAARWGSIKADFRRRKRLGGSEDDPAVRVVSQLGDISAGLESLRDGVARAVEQAAQAREQAAQAREQSAQVRPQDQALIQLVTKLDGALQTLSRPQLEVNVAASLPPGFSDLLDQQVATVERVLLPLVRTVTRSLEEGDSMRMSLIALIDDLKRLDQRLKQLSPAELSQLRGTTPPRQG